MKEWNLLIILPLLLAYVKHVKEQQQEIINLKQEKNRTREEK